MISRGFNWCGKGGPTILLVQFSGYMFSTKHVEYNLALKGPLY